MSTNFYLCPADGTGAEDPRALHVLKRVADGVIVRAHRDTPFGELASWAAWRTVLNGLDRQVWVLRDEAGEFDPERLVAAVDGVGDRAAFARRQRSGRGRNRARTSLGGPATAWDHPVTSTRCRWLDAETYYLVGYEFS